MVLAQFRVRFEVLHVRYRCGFYVKIFCARVRYRKNSHRFIQIWISFFFCAYGSTFCISSFKLRDFSRTLHQSMHVYDIEGFRMDLFKSGFKFGFFPPTWFCISFLFKGVGFFHVKYRGCMGLFKSGSKFGFFFSTYDFASVRSRCGIFALTVQSIHMMRSV